MSSISGVLLSWALLVTVSPISGDDENLRSLLAAERAFAQMSVEMGMDTAFLANLANDAKLLRPGPVNGKMWIRLNPNRSSELSWEPRFAEVSAAGDLGFTTGPWMSRSLVDSTRPPRYGHFVSLWRRDKSGTWKLEFDMGIVHEKPVKDHLAQFARERAQATVAGVQAATAVKGCQEQLLSRDQELAREFRMNTANSVSRSSFSPHALAYRMGAPPLIGVGQIADWLHSVSDTLLYSPLATAVSQSCDLGYAYGSVQQGKELGYYLRIWRKDASGGWTVVLDLDNLSR